MSTTKNFEKRQHHPTCKDLKYNLRKSDLISHESKHHNSQIIVNIFFIFLTATSDIMNQIHNVNEYNNDRKTMVFIRNASITKSLKHLTSKNKC